MDAEAVLKDPHVQRSSIIIAEVFALPGESQKKPFNPVVVQVAILKSKEVYISSNFEMKMSGYPKLLMHDQL
jgi:hypothetical protein